MVVSCIVLVVVHAHDEGAVDVLTGSGEDNLLSTSLEVRLCLATFGEETGGLEDYVNAQFLPGEVLGVTLGENLDFLAANNQCAFLDLNLFAETADAAEAVDCYAYSH